MAVLLDGAAIVRLSFKAPIERVKEGHMGSKSKAHGFCIFSFLS